MPTRLGEVTRDIWTWEPGIVEHFPLAFTKIMKDAASCNDEWDICYVYVNSFLQFTPPALETTKRAFNDHPPPTVIYVEGLLLRLHAFLFSRQASCPR